MSVIEDSIALANEVRSNTPLFQSIQLAKEVRLKQEQELNWLERITLQNKAIDQLSGPNPVNWAGRNIASGAAEGGLDVLSLGMRGPITGTVAPGLADTIQTAANVYEQTRPEQGVVSRGLRGASRSAVPMLAAGQTAGTMGAISAGVGITGSQAVTEGRLKGLRGTKLGGYVTSQMAWEGIPTIIMSKIPGLGGAEAAAGGEISVALKEGWKPFAKSLGKIFGPELAEEEIVSVGQMMTDKLFGVDQEEITPEKLGNLALDTAVQTMFMTGGVTAPSVRDAMAQKLASAKSSSRTDVLDALGANKLPPTLSSKGQREAAMSRAAEIVAETQQQPEPVPEPPPVPVEPQPQEAVAPEPLPVEEPINAEGTGAAPVQAGPETGVEGQEAERLRLRDNAEAGLETGAGEVVPAPVPVPKNKGKKRKGVTESEEVQEGQEGRQDAQVLGKQPWEMTKQEFQQEFLFHGKGETHPTYGKNKVTGGATSDYALAATYSTGKIRGKRKGEVHLIRRGKLPVGALSEMEETGRTDYVSAMGVVPAESEYVVPASESDPHKYFISKALQEGKPVSPEVLADYPDLKPTAGAVIPSEPAVATPSVPVSPEKGRAGDIDPAEVAALKRGGKSVRAIAQELGTTQGVIADILEKANVPVSEATKATEAATQEALRDTEQAPPKKGRKRGAKTTADIMQEADDNDMGTMQGGLGLALPGRVKVRGWNKPKTSKWAHPNKPSEEGHTKNHGVQKESWRRRFLNWGATAIKYATRAEAHIDRSTKNAPAHEMFRLLKEHARIVGDRVHRTTAAIIDPLNEETIDLYERTLLWRNYAENLERGEPLRNNNTDPKRDVHDYLAFLESEVPKYQEVQKALDNREIAVEEILDELVKYKLIKNADRKAYWHQQVLSKLQTNRIGTRGAQKKGRTFQHERFKKEGVDVLPEEYDINTDYIEAETSWMTQAISEIEKAKFIEKLDQLYGKRAEFAAEAKARGVDIRVVLKEHPDYAPWVPNAKSIFYKAMSLPEKFRAMLEQQSLEDMVMNGDLSKSDFQDVLAVAPREPALILPRQIVDQLEEMKTPMPQTVLGKTSDLPMKGWKVWTLLSPKRITGYTLRNLSGDVDASINVPGVFAKVPEAINMLVDLSNNKLALPKQVEAAMRHGVIGGGLTSVDIPDTKTIAVFKRFYASQGQDLVNPVGWWFDKARKFNQFREDSLRLASFLYFREQLGKGTLTNFGASNREAVREIERTLGKDAAAAHLARNLLGDYGNVTVMGDWLSRKMIPFWRWNEVNMTRYPNLIKNALTQSGAKGAAKTTAGIVLKEGAIKGMYLARIAGMYGLLQLWNNLWWPDEEEGLSNDDRANPHIILGKTSTGEVVLLRNVSAFGDFMEWFGLGEALSLMREWKEGQIDTKYLGKEVGFSILNKGFQGVRPDVRGAFETVAGQTYYPDPANPRPKARDEIAAGIVGMEDEYRAAKGAILQEGSAARKNYTARFLGVADPRQNALYEIYSLRDKYLRSVGKPQEFRGAISKFKKIRDALMNDNQEAFNDAFREYAKTHSVDDFFNHLSKLDPLETKLNDTDEAKFEYQYLNESQREKLKVSRAYVADLRDKAIVWMSKQPGSTLAEMR